MSNVRGSMIIRPWGVGIWERVQEELGGRIKDSGAQNAYFPLLIPLSYIANEADHVKGFAKEMAIVTHSRIKVEDDELQLDGKLDEPLVIRPTSETIIGTSMARWISSHRDLPMVINQWANVMRWEMRPRIFLRTAEFLWQEGHGAFASKHEAVENTIKIIEMYKQFVEGCLAVPVISGEKPESERFPGAVRTLCIEAMMQDGKALQAGTSHYLGQNFSKAANIKFQSEEGLERFAYTTSWGVSTRLIGALIMVHGDDYGLKIPPKIAPIQVVILPLIRKSTTEENLSILMTYCEEIANRIANEKFDGKKISVEISRSKHRSVDTKWRWIKKGVPLILEIGNREASNKTVTVINRSEVSERSLTINLNQFLNDIEKTLSSIQENYFNQAKMNFEKNSCSNVTTVPQLITQITKSGGFVQAHWNGDESIIQELSNHGISIRCIMPSMEKEKIGTCISSGQDTSQIAIFAKAY